MLSKDKILSIISTELSNALHSKTDGQGFTSLEESLKLYLGKPYGNELEGRSQVVSTDIADAIEWIQPQIMKSFTQNNEIVEFDAVREGDEKQAQIESQYVYEILMKQNDGFIILHQFVKDALMQANGILKVYYAVCNHERYADYTGISDQQLEMILTAPGIEIIEHTPYVDEEGTIRRDQEIDMKLQAGKQQGAPSEVLNKLAATKENPVMLHNVKLSIKRTKGQVYIDPVPPEEFRVNSNHNSINLDDARFTAHVTRMPVSDVIESYQISFEKTKELPDGYNEYDKEYRWNQQDETVFYSSDSDDESQRDIAVSECFMKIDIDETGISKLMKITVAGDSDASEIIRMEEIEAMPWISTTTFLMSHKWKGLSITDRLKEIQLQKTTLWRNMFDNIYQQNNQRNLIIEGQVRMSDLLVSRPGGNIRVKRSDAVTPLATPQIGDAAANMMSYLDRVRAGRVGVDPDGGATPQNIGDRVGSEGVDRLMDAKEELVGLIIRVIAETGIKPLMFKIRDLCMNHVDAIHDFQYRGVWYKINPTTWHDRYTCTVRVGTGSGNHEKQKQALAQVIGLQEKLAAAGSSLTDDSRIYATLDDFCRFNDLHGASKYFIDPDSPQGKKAKEAASQQKQQQMQFKMKLEEAMAKANMKIADAEMGKVQADMENARMKNKLDSQKAQADLQIKGFKQQLDEMKAQLSALGEDRKFRLEQEKHRDDHALKLTELELNADRQLDNEVRANEQNGASGA